MKEVSSSAKIPNRGNPNININFCFVFSYFYIGQSYLYKLQIYFIPYSSDYPLYLTVIKIYTEQPHPHKRGKNTFEPNIKKKRYG